MSDDDLNAALLGLPFDEDNLLFDVAWQSDDEEYMGVTCSIRITPAGERICRLMEGEGGTQ